MFRSFILVPIVLFVGCAVYHDGDRVNGILGSQGAVANTYAASSAEAVTAGIKRCDQLMDKYKPGDIVQCVDASGGIVYIGPYNAGYGYHGYYGGGVVVGHYETDLEKAAKASWEYRQARAAEEERERVRQQNIREWYDRKRIGAAPSGNFTRESCLELPPDLQSYCLEQFEKRAKTLSSP